jgi:hypothetical protein
LRARQLAGHPVEIPPELIEQAKQYSGDKAAALWEELESIGDIEVREMHYEGKYHGKDIFSFKICTPLHTYIDLASKEEIIELVQSDLETAAHASCPACKQIINYEDRDNFGNMICPCGSIMGVIPDNFADFSTELVTGTYGLEGIYTVLSCWDDLYYYDSQTDYDWLLIEKMKLKELPSIAVTISKPQISTHACTIHVHVFGSWEDTDDINGLYDKFSNVGADDTYFSVPSCYHCKYCIEVEDYGRFSNNSYFCAHPVKKNDFMEKIGIELSFDTEQLKGYQKNNEGIIKNAFMWSLLSEMKAVDRQTRDLEGKLLSPFNKFHGPICPEFNLDLKHFDLEDNGGPFRIVGEVDVVFGLANIEEIEKEMVEKENKIKLKNLIEKAHTLMQNDPYANKLFQTRIEMGNLKTEGLLLVQYLARNFTIEELELAKDNPVMPITTSHKAFQEVFKKSIALKHKQEPDTE